VREHPLGILSCFGIMVANLGKEFVVGHWSSCKPMLWCLAHTLGKGWRVQVIIVTACIQILVAWIRWMLSNSRWDSAKTSAGTSKKVLFILKIFTPSLEGFFCFLSVFFL
jgi:hypothetical protein